MSRKDIIDTGEIHLYKEKSGQTAVEVHFYGETVWLTLNQISDLFQRDKSVISRHLRNIFQTGELTKNRVVAKNATTAADGKVYQVERVRMGSAYGVRLKDCDVSRSRRHRTSETVRSDAGGVRGRQKVRRQQKTGVSLNEMGLRFSTGY